MVSFPQTPVVYRRGTGIVIPAQAKGSVEPTMGSPTPAASAAASSRASFGFRRYKGKLNDFPSSSSTTQQQQQQKVEEDENDEQLIINSSIATTPSVSETSEEDDQQHQQQHVLDRKLKKSEAAAGSERHPRASYVASQPKDNNTNNITTSNTNSNDQTEDMSAMSEDVDEERKKEDTTSSNDHQHQDVEKKKKKKHRRKSNEAVSSQLSQLEELEESQELGESSSSLRKTGSRRNLLKKNKKKDKSSRKSSSSSIASDVSQISETTPDEGGTAATSTNTAAATTTTTTTTSNPMESHPSRESLESLPETKSLDIKKKKKRTKCKGLAEDTVQAAAAAMEEEEEQQVQLEHERKPLKDSSSSNDNHVKATKKSRSGSSGGARRRSMSFSGPRTTTTTVGEAHARLHRAKTEGISPAEAALKLKKKGAVKERARSIGRNRSASADAIRRKRSNSRGDVVPKKGEQCGEEQQQPTTPQRNRSVSRRRRMKQTDADSRGELSRSSKDDDSLMDDTQITTTSDDDGGGETANIKDKDATTTTTTKKKKKHSRHSVELLQQEDIEQSLQHEQQESLQSSATTETEPPCPPVEKKSQIRRKSKDRLRSKSKDRPPRPRTSNVRTNSSDVTKEEEDSIAAAAVAMELSSTNVATDKEQQQSAITKSIEEENQELRLKLNWAIGELRQVAFEDALGEKVTVATTTTTTTSAASTDADATIITTTAMTFSDEDIKIAQSRFKRRIQNYRNSLLDRDSGHDSTDGRLLAVMDDILEDCHDLDDDEFATLLVKQAKKLEVRQQRQRFLQTEGITSQTQEEEEKTPEQEQHLSKEAILEKYVEKVRFEELQQEVEELRVEKRRASQLETEMEELKMERDHLKELENEVVELKREQYYNDEALQGKIEELEMARQHAKEWERKMQELISEKDRAEELQTKIEKLQAEKDRLLHIEAKMEGLKLEQDLVEELKQEVAGLKQELEAKEALLQRPLEETRENVEDVTVKETTDEVPLQADTILPEKVEGLQSENEALRNQIAQLKQELTEQQARGQRRGSQTSFSHVAGDGMAHDDGMSTQNLMRSHTYQKRASLDQSMRSRIRQLAEMSGNERDNGMTENEMNGVQAFNGDYSDEYANEYVDEYGGSKGFLEEYGTDYQEGFDEGEYAAEPPQEGHDGNYAGDQYQHVEYAGEYRDDDAYAYDENYGGENARVYDENFEEEWHGEYYDNGVGDLAEEDDDDDETEIDEEAVKALHKEMEEKGLNPIITIPSKPKKAALASESEFLDDFDDNAAEAFGQNADEAGVETDEDEEAFAFDALSKVSYNDQTFLYDLQYQVNNRKRARREELMEDALSAYEKHKKATGMVEDDKELLRKFYDQKIEENKARQKQEDLWLAKKIAQVKATLLTPDGKLRESLDTDDDSKTQKKRMDKEDQKVFYSVISQFRHKNLSSGKREDDSENSTSDADSEAYENWENPEAMRALKSIDTSRKIDYQALAEEVKTANIAGDCLASEIIDLGNKIKEKEKELCKIQRKQIEPLYHEINKLKNVLVRKEQTIGGMKNELTHLRKRNDGAEDHIRELEEKIEREKYSSQRSLVLHEIREEVPKEEQERSMNFLDVEGRLEIGVGNLEPESVKQQKKTFWEKIQKRTKKFTLGLTKLSAPSSGENEIPEDSERLKIRTIVEEGDLEAVPTPAVKSPADSSSSSSSSWTSSEDDVSETKKKKRPERWY